MGGQARTFTVELPDDPDVRAFVAALLTENESLKQRVRELEKMYFGPRSEKTKTFDAAQPGLLPFPDFLALAAKAEDAKQAARKELIEVPAHQRKKPGRRSDFPDHLPRHRNECKIPVGQRTCCGRELRIFGNEVSKEVERIEFFYVVEHAREKGVCDSCGRIVVAEGPERVLDRCLLGPNFLSRLMYERFGNHMPYARLERKYADEGLDLSRSVICSSVLRCAELLRPVYEALRKEVLGAYVVQADDTEIVQRFGKRKGRKKVNLWAYRDQDGGVFYEVTQSRSRDGPRATLEGRSGYLQCDGHKCFDEVGDDIVRLGCWAHLRRKFRTALEGGDELAREPLGLIRRVFAVERLARRSAMPPAEVLALRQAKSRATVDQLKAWLDQQQLAPERTPKSPLMKGVTYGINQWESLKKFLEDGKIRDITNNGCERALRGPVLGRKNWLYFGDEAGARLGPIVMSLVQSCKELAINPLLYLADVLRAISKTPASRVADLTPRHWKERLAQQSSASRPTIEAAVRGVIDSE